MSVQLVLKNSSVQDKEATAAQLAVGELALNYHSSGPFLQCEDSAGNIWRLGGVVIASTAPSSPSKGAWWLDSDDDHLYFYDGTSWIEIQTGEIVPGDITEGTARQLLQTNAAGTATEWTSNIDVPGTLDVTGVATFDNNVVITGNLTVNGTTTTIDTTTLVVEDKNIELGVVGTPTDTTADGGGITVKGATDKTLTWVNSTGMWTSNQPFDVAGEVQCDSLDVDGAADISGDVTLHGNLDLQDNDKILLGDSDDLQIYHDGSNSVIADIGAGQLQIRTNQLRVNNAANNENLIACDQDGNVQIYNDGALKFATTSTGINVTGRVTCDGLTSDGSIDIESSTGVVNLKDTNNTGSGAQSEINFKDSNNATLGFLGYANTSDNDFYLANSLSGSIQFNTNGQTRFEINNSGHVLPNTSGALDLGSSTNQWRSAWFDGEVTCDGMTSDGRVFIRGGDPALILQDTDSTGTGSSATISGRDSAGSNKWYIGDSSGSNENLVFYNYATADLLFSTNNGGKQISLTSAGHWVPADNNAQDLGTSSTQWRNAYFDGTVTCDGLITDGGITVSTTSGRGLELKDSDSTGTDTETWIKATDSAGAQKWFLGDVNNSPVLYVANTQGGDIIFKTNDVDRLKIASDGSSVFPASNNTVDLGTSSNQWRSAYFDDSVYTDLLQVDEQAGFLGKVYGSYRTATASSFNLATGNFWTFGAIAVPNPSNQTTGISGLLVVTAAPTSFASNWKFPGGSYTAPTTFPAVAPFFIQSAGSSILVGSWTEGIA